MDRNEIKKLIHEKLINENQESTNTNDTSSSSGAEMSGLYKRVQGKLANDLFNHAAVMRRLNWDGDENTNRSLFEKKLKRAKNDSGGNYEFTKEELEKILTILDTAATQR